MSSISGNLITEIIARLPTFPKVVLDLLGMLRDENVSLDTLARVARNDPVISASVLAAANRMRRLRALPDLQDPYVAASCVGTNKLRSIVVTAGMNRFIAQNRADTFLFEHSLAVAIIAHELAFLSSTSPEEAYVAGILHDIGQLAFFVADKDLYRQVLAAQASTGSNLLQLEEQAFGLDHGQAGVLLACEWNLPTSIVQAIAGHHQEQVPCSGKVQALINIAETLARGMDMPPAAGNRVASFNSGALEMLGLRWDMPELQDCLGRARARFQYALA